MAGTREAAVSERVAAASVIVVAASDRVAAMADVGAGGSGVVFVGALLTGLAISSGTRAGVTPLMSCHAGRRSTVVAVESWSPSCGTGMSDAESIRC